MLDIIMVSVGGWGARSCDKFFCFRNVASNKEIDVAGLCGGFDGIDWDTNAGVSNLMRSMRSMRGQVHYGMPLTMFLCVSEKLIFYLKKVER